MGKWVFAFLVAMTVFANADQPRYLYKVMSLADWDASQQQDLLKLSRDKSVVPLLKLDQLEKTILTDWNTASEVIIVEIDVDKLSGPLTAENDDHGKAISYLYNGGIPLSAISEPRIVRFH
jgi:uncharacterized protein (DUF952 family)